jgi:hypothetical protein
MRIIHALSILHPSMNIKRNILIIVFQKTSEHVNFILDIQS